MKKVKIAQIGVSHDHARDIFDSILALEDIFEVIGYAVCNGEEEFMEKLPPDCVFSKATRMSVEEILEYPDLQAVTIECKEQDLTEYAHLAAENGLHIHMDKPGSEDHTKFKNFVQLCKENKLVLHLGYMYRYNPIIQKALKMVKSGKLGKLYSVEAQMSLMLTKEKRKWLQAFDGGMMFYLGCHMIDLIVLLQGPPKEIIPLNKATKFDDVESLDSGMAILKYDNGVSFARTNATEAGGGLRRQLVILGENGTLEIRPLERWLRHGVGRNNLVTEIREIYKDEALKGGGMFSPEKTEIAPVNRYDAMMTAFAEMASGEKENPFTYEYEVQLHKIIMQACGISCE